MIGSNTMAAMTTFERMKRMYEHRDADRVPVTDGPWGSTIERWQREGMPKDVSFRDYFDLDDIAGIGVDTSPHYPVETIEQTDEYTIHTTAWGATLKNWKHAGGVPQFLDFKIQDPDSWAEAKARMQPGRDRVNWDHLKAGYPKWRENGAWISALLWFGFDVAHSWTIGTERVLMALSEQPEWMVDVFNGCLDASIALLDMVWDEGYHFDEVMWYDDMGYKQHTFFSTQMYRELVKPVHKRACEWAHAKGAKVRLHSCGFVKPLIPDLIDAGVDMLNPIEVKAGMNPVELKQEFGDRLAFHGGLNAVLYDKPEELWAEMRRVIPVMKQNGGYLISSDHSVPETVSLAQFTEFVRLAKELGTY